VDSFNGLNATAVRLDMAVLVRSGVVTWDASNARYRCGAVPVNGTWQRTLSTLARKEWIVRSGTSVMLAEGAAEFLTKCGR